MSRIWPISAVISIGETLGAFDSQPKVTIDAISRTRLETVLITIYQFPYFQLHSCVQDVELNKVISVRTIS